MKAKGERTRLGDGETGRPAKHEPFHGEKGERARGGQGSLERGVDGGPLSKTNEWRAFMGRAEGDPGLPWSHPNQTVDQ